MVRMFRFLRCCLILTFSGFIGMLAGFLPQVVIDLFLYKDPVIVQSVYVFREIDFVSFFICMFGLSGLVLFCIAVECKQFIRWLRQYSDKSLKI